MWPWILLACAGAPDDAAPEDPVSIEVTENGSATAPAHPAPPEAAGEARLPPFGPLPSEPARNALIIIIDTLRADALAAAATPHIDSIAQAGQSVARAWSAGTWTAPSVISILTGRPVRQHGWDQPTGRMGKYPQLPSVPSLPQVLSEAGFSTTGLYTNPYLAEELGFHRGFDTWRRVSDKIMVKEFAKVLLNEWDGEGRHFAYLHLLGPHSPLQPSEAARARWDVEARWFEEARFGMDIGAAKRDRTGEAREAYRRGYHAVIEDTDAIIGGILEALGEQRAETLIVLSSDHGELLGEHEVVGHGYWVWEGLTHVPLIVENGPPLPEALGIASIPGIVTHGLGLDTRWETVEHGWVEGVPLASQREGKLALSADGVSKGVWHDAASAKSVEVYDLSTDPGELERLPREAELRQLRGQWETLVPPGRVGPAEVALPEQTKEELKALGYVEE
ncbi:MAG: sulfatase-like hydrolase/transferase [Alphaproteobacteria bacterium]|nr:sulfatase-like hydrolase/transferase [Alphaproteobacteria bacterium]MCB9792815.1 sulfatase-like hydrolase/transferase [Alphaproteobacteria bacterium]